MGLMPAYRAAPDALYSLKAVCIAPGNPARGLDSHQGFVALFDGETGEPRAFVNASRDHGDPHRRRLGRRDAAARPARVAHARDPRRRRRRRGRTSRRCAPCCRSSACACGAGRRSARPSSTASRWRRPPRRRSTAPTSSSPRRPSREPIVRREWLADGAHVNAVGSSIPSTRELDSATMAAAALFVDRRESTLNESGDYLFAARRRRDRPREHPRRDRRAAERLGRGPSRRPPS